MRFIRGAVAILTGLFAIAGARAADTYIIDPAHSSAGFTVTHLVISEVSGRFDDLAGSITYDPDTKAVTGAEATIQAKSVDTNISKRDDDLRSPRFFDVEKYPTITFETTKVEKDGDRTFIAGKFTMHGVTKEIRFPFVAKGPIKDPWGNMRIGVVAETSLNRTDYGMKSVPGVGDEVQIKLSVEATLLKK